MSSVRYLLQLTLSSSPVRATLTAYLEVKSRQIKVTWTSTSGDWPDIVVRAHAYLCLGQWERIEEEVVHNSVINLPCTNFLNSSKL